MVTDLNELMADDTGITDDMFITVDTPVDETMPKSDFVCVVCGKDVSHLYKRRVKEPRCEEHKKNGGASNLGTGPRKRSASKDVEAAVRSEEHTSELQSLMRISYAVFCFKKKKHENKKTKKIAT